MNEVKVGGQAEQLRQCSDDSEVSEGGEEHAALKFVPVEDVGFFAPMINGD